MNTLKNTLKRDYSQIPNELITDMSISHGELRVLLYLFTKPDDWNVYNKDICKQLNISEQTLTKYWKNLLKSKWLRREIASSKNGKLTGGYIYLIGNFTVSIESTETVKSIGHSNTKPLKKKETTTKPEADLNYFPELWNQLVDRVGISTSVKKMTDSRKSKIRARLGNAANFYKAWEIIMSKIESSDYLLENHTWFSFDWLIQNDTNYVKVIEGKYDDRD